MNRSFLFLIILLCTVMLPVMGQNHHERYGSVDILNYHFEIDLNDTTDMIRGTALVDVLFKTDVDQFYMDLKNKNTTGTGMVITELLEDGVKAVYQHDENRIVISTTQSAKGIIKKYTIKYQGIPADGLIISKNKYGDRTFFGDNWPNRAHHWLPVVDHPSDKAMVEFLIHAPEQYGVVANGTNVKEWRENYRVFSHWKTAVPLPVKLMVIGVSPFSVKYSKSASGIPVSSWVFPQNQEDGFLDYGIAVQPLDFFESYIAPYPYTKLANVQSKTVYGGMENASCIFYSERSVNGKQELESLFAHDIAHQWFGDAVSELNWHHVWISEGFATYLADIYLEHTYGRKVFVASMKDERNQVIEYSRRRLAPILDTSLAVTIRLLNNNSYEKAGWVLHMLRGEIGDELFRDCVCKFYEEFKFGNALTCDFRKVVETVTGKDYTSFFYQWFYQPGHPVLSLNWDHNGNETVLRIKQHQEQCIFEFPLNIEITDSKGSSGRHTVFMNAPEQTFLFNSPHKPSRILPDPETWLLFEYH